MLELLTILLSKLGLDMFDKYENSPTARRLIHMILFLVFMFAIASILQGIGAVKWW